MDKRRQKKKRSISSRPEYELRIDDEVVIRVNDEMNILESGRYWIKLSYTQRMAEGRELENIDKGFPRIKSADHCDRNKTHKPFYHSRKSNS